MWSACELSCRRSTGKAWRLKMLNAQTVIRFDYNGYPQPNRFFLGCDTHVTVEGWDYAPLCNNTLCVWLCH